MQVTNKPLFILLIFFCLGAFAKSPSKSHESHSGGAVDTPNEIDAYVQHHVKDSHDFHLFSYDSADGERKHVSFPLPVIVWSSKGPVAFMSSAFHHDDEGHHVVEAGGTSFVKLHSKIYELNAGATEIEIDDHHPKNAHKVIDLSITKSVLGSLIVGLLLIWAFTSLAKQYKNNAIPKGLGRLLEPLVIYVRDDIARPNIGEKHYRKFLGFLLTVFFFIWLSNLLGLTPLGYNITGQIAITACLAIFTLFIYVFKGNGHFGVTFCGTQRHHGG